MLGLLLLLALFSFPATSTTYTVCASGCTYANTQTGLQAAIDTATCGDIIELTAGETTTINSGSPLTLKFKTCSPYSYIKLRSSGVPGLTPGAKVTSSDASKMAKISVSTGTWAAITNEQKASWYWFEGIEITSDSTFFGDLVEFGTRTNVFSYVADNEIEDLAHHIVFNQCWIHGNSASTDGPRRGIRANLASMTVMNSLIENLKNQNGESNAIGGWQSLGPFYFINNRLEAAAITTLFGGAEPNIRGIRANGNFFIGNHYYRPWKWRVRYHSGNPSGDCLWDSSGGEYYKNTDVNTYWRCDSGVWTSILVGAFSPYYWQKNIFELKNAWRTWVEGNFIENAWNPATQNQFGAMFLFNLVDADPGSGPNEPSATVGYVDIRNNYGRRTPWLVSMGNIGSTYYLWHNNINLQSNVFEEIGDSPFTLDAAETNGSKWGGGFMNFPFKGINIGYNFNTLISRAPVESRAGYLFGSTLTSQTERAEINGNIFSWNKYGLYNDNGAGALWNSIPESFAPGYSVHRNLVVNNQSQTIYAKQSSIINLAYNADTGSSAGMPCVGSTNEMTGSGATYNGKCAFPAAYSDVGFTDYSTNDYSLDVSSNYLRWGPMGFNPGANTSQVSWSTSGVNSAGSLPVFLNFRVKTVTPTSSSLAFRYVAPTTGTCTTSVSLKSDMSSPTSTTDSGGDAARTASITGLSANKRYYWQVVCDSSYTRDGIILTSP